MVSYDVKVLFASVSVNSAISIVKSKLLQGPLLPQETSISIQQISTLLEFCFKYTYFLLQGRYFEQINGVAIGSPISSLITNLFLPPIHPGFGLDMWMTLSSSSGLIIVTRSFSSSSVMTPTSSSPWKIPEMRVPYLSWTPCFPQAQQHPYNICL